MTAQVTRADADMKKRKSPSRGSTTHRLRVWGLRLALVTVIVALWLFANRPGGISPLILPELGKVAQSFVDLVITPDTWRQAGITVFEMVVAFSIAAVVGLGTGFALSRNRISSRTAEPLFAWGYLFPFVLLYPLFLLWVGVGIQSKIAYAATGAFFPIAYNTIRGLRSIDERYLKVGKAFGASAFQMDIDVKLGAARPMILSGLRIGSSIVTISVVLAELLGSNAGLGHEIEQASSRFQIANSYAVVVLLIVIAAVLQAGLERLLKPRHK
ncbi:ABC transporter permease [Dactylosporangium sp. NPDC000555]|uniref:ABC transporter permease n=1 Tax=Dactylosporangium sp. NPDC000555 TaxID=3154260 RepID=UPI003326307D